MASTAEAGQAQETVKAAVPVVPLVLAVVVAVLLAVAGVGGALVWMVRSGKLPLGGGAAKAEAAPAEAAKTHEVTLEPLLVNLADEGGHSYLRVGLELKVQDAPKPKTKEEKPEVKGFIEHNAEVRDAALSIIGDETSDQLLAPDGKEKLKAQLRAALAARVPEMKVDDLYFTEFLVQR